MGYRNYIPSLKSKKPGKGSGITDNGSPTFTAPSTQPSYTDNYGINQAVTPTVGDSSGMDGLLNGPVGEGTADMPSYYSAGVDAISGSGAGANSLSPQFKDSHGNIVSTPSEDTRGWLGKLFQANNAEKINRAYLASQALKQAEIGPSLALNKLQTQQQNQLALDAMQAQQPIVLDTRQKESDIGVRSAVDQARQLDALNRSSADLSGNVAYPTVSSAPGDLAYNLNIDPQAEITNAQNAKQPYVPVNKAGIEGNAKIAEEKSIQDARIQQALLQQKQLEKMDRPTPFESGGILGTFDPKTGLHSPDMGITAGHPTQQGFDFKTGQPIAPGYAPPSFRKYSGANLNDPNSRGPGVGASIAKPSYGDRMTQDVSGIMGDSIAKPFSRQSNEFVTSSNNGVASKIKGTGGAPTTQPEMQGPMIPRSGALNNMPQAPENNILLWLMKNWKQAIGGNLNPPGIR